jgi:hypothetical protein
MAKPTPLGAPRKRKILPADPSKWTVDELAATQAHGGLPIDGRTVERRNAKLRTIAAELGENREAWPEASRGRKPRERRRGYRREGGRLVRQEAEVSITPSLRRSIESVLKLAMRVRIYVELGVTTLPRWLADMVMDMHEVMMGLEKMGNGQDREALTRAYKDRITRVLARCLSVALENLLTGSSKNLDVDVHVFADFGLDVTDRELAALVRNVQLGRGGGRSKKKSIARGVIDLLNAKRKRLNLPAWRTPSAAGLEADGKLSAR